MKRSILLAALTLFVAVNASAQRKVLVEEFTSSTCPPCAATDPIMEAYEEERHQDIVVLKYHQNYPQAGDIMYNAYPDARDRHDYYGVEGIPHVQFNGTANVFPNSVPALEAPTDEVMDASDVYYNLSVTQEITADSIIAVVTVNSGADIDPAARLTVVVAEGNVIHQGSNGRRYHTAAVRTAMPAFASNGAPGGPALGMAANSQQTFRFAAKLNAAWNKDLLNLVAFVQNPTSKMVMGVETNKPDVFVKSKGSSLSVVGSTTSQAHWIVSNLGSTPQTVKLTSMLSKTTPYSGTIRDLNGTDLGANPITLAPGEEKEVVAALTTSGANIESQIYAINAATASGIGITGAAGIAWPGGAKNVFLDAGVTTYTETASGANNYLSALTSAGLEMTVLSYADMSEAFPNLDQFDNIFWAGGYTQGIYPGTGDLSQSDTNKIRQFLAKGGNIAFSSMVMAGGYHSAGWGDFAEEVFGVIAEPIQIEQGVTGWSELIGVEGDVLGNNVGTAITLTNMVGNMPLEVSTVNPTAKAAFRNELDEVVGVHANHTSGGKSVYMAFEPGNITNLAKRRAVVKRVVDWFNGALSVGQESEKNGIVLKQNYPNPFNPGTVIGFELPESGRVTLKVQDMMGREVATVLENEHRNAGENIAHFDAANLPSGNYVYILNVNGQRLERKMTLAK